MIKNPEKVNEGHAKDEGNETANLEIIYAMSLNKALPRPPFGER